MITLTASVRNSLPRVTYVKYSDWILTTCLVYVFGALVEFAVINFHESLEARKREKLKNKLRNIDIEREVSGMKIAPNINCMSSWATRSEAPSWLCNICSTVDME